MSFKILANVIKISVSDMPKAILFYQEILNFKIQEEYTINSNGDYGLYSYVQLYKSQSDGGKMIIGLFKDLEKPYSSVPETGTVPSFIVEDIMETLKYLQSKSVQIDKINGEIIQKNTSIHDKTDHFFFFQDLDKNSLVARQNMN